MKSWKIAIVYFISETLRLLVIATQAFDINKHWSGITFEQLTALFLHGRLLRGTALFFIIGEKNSKKNRRTMEMK